MLRNENEYSTAGGFTRTARRFFARKYMQGRNGYALWTKIAEITTRISVRIDEGFGNIDKVGLFLNFATQFANAGAAIVPTTYPAR